MASAPQPSRKAWSDRWRGALSGDKSHVGIAGVTLHSHVHSLGLPTLPECTRGAARNDERVLSRWGGAPGKVQNLVLRRGGGRCLRNEASEG